MNIVLTILIVLLSAILVLIFALLMLKIRLVIDTDNTVLIMSQKPLYKIKALAYTENPAKIDVVLFGIPFTLDFLKRTERQKRKNRPVKERKRSKRSANTRQEMASKFSVLASAIKIKYLHTSVDTGDFEFNAALFPAVHFLNQNTDEKYWFEINFLGENYLKTQIESRPVWVIMALIKSKRNQIKTK